MLLTQEQINKINEACPNEWNYNEQGIFKEPSNIPTHVKEPVIYMKWESSGKPGTCWDDEDTINEEYTNPFNIDNWTCLHLTLKELNQKMPDNIDSIITIEPEFDTTSNGYYGDYENSTVAWILLSDLYKILKLN